MVDLYLRMFDKDAIDFPSIETSDKIQSKKSGPFSPELNGFTPLMLAVVGPKPSINCVRALLSAGADQHVRDKATGNNILHLAASMCSSETVFDYLFENLKVDVFESNNANETPLTLCKSSFLKSPRRVAKIEEV